MLTVRSIRRALAVTLATGLWTATLVTPGLAAGACAVPGADEPAVAAARAAVQQECDCAGSTDARSWRVCVRDSLAGTAGEGLSTGCARLVRRLEARSTCGRPDHVVCCRTNAGGLTKGALRRTGKCSPPRGGSACESPLPYLADGCTSDGCVLPPGCGNSVVESGESCDPPDGTTCSSTCSSCAAAAPGEILLGCVGGSTAVAASAVSSTLLVSYTDQSATSATAHAKRLANDGSVVDAAPLVVSGTIPGSNATDGFLQTATADGTDFYLGWSSYADFQSYFAGRRIPATGPITSPIELIASDFPIGSCRVSMSGPLKLAPNLAGTGFLPTWRNVYSCGGTILLETLTGVGDFFSVPPPGNTSTGPAPIVRGANDVAAVWRNLFVSSLSPPLVQELLAASWIEPGPPSLLQLSSGLPSVTPALAAVGDTFVAVWATGNDVRITRFTRAGGVLDPDGGLLVATGGGAIGQVEAASDGTHVVAAWRESAGAGQSTIRALRIAPDGSLPSPLPVDVATSTANAAVSVAANPTATLVAFTRDESPAVSVRAVLLED